MLNKDEIESLLKNISQGFRKIPQVENILYPLDINQFQKLNKYIEQLENQKDIMQRALSMQTQGWNKGAKLLAEKQKLIEKLEEDIRVYSKEGCCRKQVREGIVREAQEILTILKGG